MRAFRQRPSEPPPEPDDLGFPSSTPQQERTMSAIEAGGWTLGITLLFFWLALLLMSLRPGAPLDLLKGVGCQVVAYLAGLFGILQLYAPRSSIRRFLGVRATHAGFYPLGVALGVALHEPLSQLYAALERRFPSGHPGDLTQQLVEAHLAGRVALGVCIIAIGPAVEELIFRGAFFRPLYRRYDAVTAVAMAAVLFALAHVEVNDFLPMLLFGLALGLVRVVSGSLVPPFLMHAALNAVSFGSLLVEVRSGLPAAGQPPAAGAPASPWLLVGSSAASLGLLALACVLGRHAESAAGAREKDTA